MRSNDAEYDLIAPKTLDAVLQAMAAEPGALTPIAGGTELMVALGAGRLQARRLISLDGIRDLRFIESVDEHTVRVGSGTTFTDLRRSSVIAESFPMLAQTASWTGSLANQNRGTIGGNLANASPAADTPPALLAYGAEIELISTRGVRTMPYESFHLSYKRTLLAPDELILAVRLPRLFAQHLQWTRKVGARNAQAISKIAIAAAGLVRDGLIQDIRIGAASVRDRPIRLYGVENAVRGRAVDKATIAKAREAVSVEVSPIDDIRSTAKYRVAVMQNLVEEYLNLLKG